MDWTATVTAIGTVLGGLALPLAFVQLGALRQDRLRAQVSKVGVWVGEWEPALTRAQEQPCKIPVHVRNSSELPVMALEVRLYVIPRAGDGKTVTLQPQETITPGQTWKGTCEYREDPARENQEPVRVFIRRATVADAAGHQWEIRPYRGGRPRLLRWPRRRWHYSEGRITGPA